MRELLNIIIIVIISAAAGAAVSLPISAIEGSSLLRGMLNGAAAGSVIGFAARFAFSVVYQKLRKRPPAAFLAMSATVGVGTLLACLITGIKLVPAGIAAVAVSVAVGLVLTAVIFNYSKKLNERLQRKQNTLSNPGA